VIAPEPLLTVRAFLLRARRNVEYARRPFVLTFRPTLELLAAHAPDFDHGRFSLRGFGLLQRWLFRGGFALSFGAAASGSF